MKKGKVNAKSSLFESKDKDDTDETSVATATFGKKALEDLL